MSERLGHATVGITLDLYSHVAPSLAKDAAEQIMSSTYGSDGGTRRDIRERPTTPASTGAHGAHRAWSQGQ